MKRIVCLGYSTIICAVAFAINSIAVWQFASGVLPVPSPLQWLHQERSETKCWSCGSKDWISPNKCRFCGATWTP